MNHLDTFSGIGCFSMAAEYVWKDEHNIHSFIEIDPFKQQWLRANWPGVKIHDDADTYKHDGTAIDLLTGGPPCQPVSIAGKRKGDADDRWKWTAMLRIIQEVHPTWVIFENVYGILSMVQYGVFFDMEGNPITEMEEGIYGMREGPYIAPTVLEDLEKSGYGVQLYVVPACAVNAPHRRDRVWVVAHAGQTNGEAQSGYGMENEKQGAGLQTTLPSSSSSLAHTKQSNIGGGPDQPQREPEGGIVIDRNGESGLGDTSGKGLEIRPEPENEQRTLRSKGETACASSNRGSGVADADVGSEKQRISQSNIRSIQNRNVKSYWSDYEWITGHDGKQRRVKPGVRLLVNGYPHRNDLLRCFGEAIVWQTVVPIMQAIKAIDES